MVDLAVARAEIGDRVTLVGNVHTVTELLQGDRKLVHAAAELASNAKLDRSETIELAVSYILSGMKRISGSRSKD